VFGDLAYTRFIELKQEEEGRGENRNGKRKRDPELEGLEYRRRSEERGRIMTR
jgi:hypothetical protein